MPRGAVRAGVAGTAIVHLLGFGLLIVFSMTSAPRTMPPSYAVELVAASPRPASARPAARTAAPPVTRPAPARNRPAPERSTSQTRPQQRTVPVTPLPGETPSTGSDIANVNLKGKPFPFPDYLRNLVAQIYRRWNRPAGSALSAEVSFVILRDGSVREIGMALSSRSHSFDNEALAAVEAAAAARAFGPLPAGYGADYLQINFTFAPRQ